MPRKPPQKSNPSYTIHKYTVIRVHDEDLLQKIFECIPDRWFVDETKSSCFWPPSTGKSFTVRAINCEKPDDTWNIHECTAVSEGHLTYKSGFNVVKEKCSQKYNTSSADEHITAAEYRREHPVLALLQQNDGTIEQIFGESDKRDKTKKQTQNKRQIVKPTTECNEQNGNSSESLSETVTPQIIELMDEGLIADDLAQVDAQNSVQATPRNDKVSCLSKPRLSRSPRAGVPGLNLTSSNRRSSSSGSSKSPVSGSKNKRSNNTSTRTSRRSSTSSSRKSSATRSDRSRSSRSSSNVSSASATQRSRSGSKKNGRSSSIQSSRSADQILSAARKKNLKMSKNKRSDTSGRTSRRSSSSGSDKSSISRSKRLRSSRSSSNGSSSSAYQRCRSGSRSPSIQLNKFAGQSFSAARNKNSEVRKRNLIKSDTNLIKSTEKRQPQPAKSRDSIRLQSRLSLSPSKSDRFESRSPSRSYNFNRPDVRREKSQAERFRDNPSKRSRIDLRDSPITHNDPPSHRLSKHHLQSYNISNDRVVGSDSSLQKRIDISGTESTIRDLKKIVTKMNETIRQNHEQLKCYDRRLQRMEVTVNKVLVLVGDLNGHGETNQDENLNDERFNIPELPIGSTKELSRINKKLKNKEFEAYFLQHEKEFCCPSKNASDTATISKYLKRFVSLRVRSKLTLKENGEGDTLYEDYRHVYLFLVDVMKAGYRNAKKSITSNDAHTALRIVWGRSKQQYRETKPKRK